MQAIYDRRGYPVGRVGQGLLVCWGILLTVGFVLAGSLNPDPRLYGTHQQLGLPPCSFRVLFGLPCPSCGMTTSFACFVQGRFPEAVRANPAGLLLAIVCLVQIPWCWWSASQGRLWWILEPLPTTLWILLTLSGLCLINWIWRLAVIFHS